MPNLRRSAAVAVMVHIRAEVSMHIVVGRGKRNSLLVGVDAVLIFNFLRSCWSSALTLTALTFID